MSLGELSTHVETVDPNFDVRFIPGCRIDWVYGDCCEPVIYHGEGALVDKAAPVRPGDIVAITARTPGERQGLTTGFVKRFIGWGTGSSGRRVLVTEMLNPRRQRIFLASDVIVVHRVVAVVSVGNTDAIERLEAMDVRNRAAA